ncbi:MAG: hypothetical protein ABI134_09665 [Byssovorax sp.]
MSRSWSLAWALLAGSCLTGCGDDVFGNKDAHQPGEVLGTYHVAAKRGANTCGDGALGNQAAWEFDVKLARGGAQIFWNNGAEIIDGAIDADQKSFHFDTGVLMDMRTAEDHGLPACSIERSDHAEGTLAATGTDVASFEGKLAFGFAPSAGSSCDDLVQGSTAILAALPCSIVYAITGTRTAAP